MVQVNYSFPKIFLTMASSWGWSGILSIDLLLMLQDDVTPKQQIAIMIIS